MDTDFIDEFKGMMELKYAEHHPKKGDSWKDCSMGFLWDKFLEEAREVCERAASQYEPDKDTMSELVDVALVAAMLWAREKKNLIDRLDEGLPQNFTDGLYAKR